MQTSLISKRVVIAALALVIGSRVTHVVNARSTNKACGKFTLADILRRSRPICSAMTPNCNSLNLVGTPLQTGGSRNASRNVWMVDGYDAHNRFQVHLVWDADSGDLITASHATPWPSAPRTRLVPIQRKEALRITGSWLTTLGIAKEAPDWRPDSTPQDTDFVWRVEWTADTRKIAVTIDAWTGELRIVQNMVRANGAPARLVATSSPTGSRSRL